jgi:alpha-1,6-mannosyltransferase
VVAAALSGRATARFYDPRNAELALLAIGFNPLFLIEGPGSGHNDVLMVALMLSGIALCLKGRARIGYFVVGLSIGIKFVTAAIVPWLIIRQLSRQPAAKRLSTGVLALGLAFLPTLVAYAAFQVRTNALDGIKAVYEHQTDGVQETPSTTDASRSRPIPAPGGRGPRALWRAVALILVYGALTLVVWRFDATGVDLLCWAIFSMALVLIGTPVPFPWYMVWPLSGALIRWDRLGVKVNLACAALTVMLLVQYTVLYVRR